MGGGCNTVRSGFSAIIGGYHSSINDGSSDSVIVGGQCHQLNVAIMSSIIGGCCNTLQYNSSYSSIVGGFCNTIATQSTFSSIVGGECNILQCNSYRSSIIGGCGNTLSFSSNSSIIGGINNLICNSSCNSVIIGGTNLVLDNSIDLVYVPELKIATASNDDTLSKVLVWDDTSSFKAKWRNLSVINFSPQNADYTLVLEDAGKVVDINSGSNQLLTIPDEASVNFTVGTQIVVIRSGTGEVTITPATASVIVSSAQGFLSLNWQYSAATLLKTGSDTWYAFGDLKV
jgi:hypothetical protein